MPASFWPQLSSWQFWQERLSWPWRVLIALAPRLDERPGLVVALDRDRHPARLLGDVCGERQQVAALMGERRRLLLLGAAEVDALLEIDRAALRGAERRIARRNAAHRLRGVAVAVGAGLAFAAGLAAPQRLAVEHRERRGIRRVVVLHRLRAGAHHVVAGAALVERNFGAGRAVSKATRNATTPVIPAARSAGGIHDHH